ncbi:MAG TPA: hypothetical protein VGC41_29530, partial [Kofleriaceae bacterium]
VVGEICETCMDELSCTGHAGEPEILHAPLPLRLVTATRDVAVPDLHALAPMGGADRDRWLGVSADGGVYELLDGVATERARITPVVGAVVYVSRDGRFAAIVEARGVRGVVIDFATNMQHAISRDGYHSGHCEYPFAFVERDGRTLFVHSPRWNKLDLCDAESGECITPRTADELKSHLLDYFHASLRVSPDQRLLSDDGWVWGPEGSIKSVSIDAWVASRFETEDGPTRKHLESRAYGWGMPLVWIGNDELVFWGYGRDEESLVRAAQIWNGITGKRVRWFGGVVHGQFCIDERQLIAFDKTTLQVWDLDRGALVATVEHPGLAFYHPSAKLFSTAVIDGKQTVAHLAGHHTVDHELVQRGDPADLSVLADVLEVRGFTDEYVLAHARSPGEHHGRCWVFERLR